MGGWGNTWCSHYYSTVATSTDASGAVLVEYMCIFCGHRYNIKYEPAVIYTPGTGGL